MKKQLKKILFSSFLFLFYFYFSYIVNFIMSIFKIDYSSWNRLLLILFVLALDIIPILILIFVYRKDLKKEFEIFKKDIVKNYDEYLRLWFFGIILMSFLNIIVGFITKSNISNNEEAIRDIAKVLPLYSLFTASICAPLGEELAFRKTIKNIFINEKLSIIMSGVIFGLAHVIGTYEQFSDILYALPYGAFGSIFMYIYLKSKNIWTTISIHFLHNTILTLIMFMR